MLQETQEEAPGGCLRIMLLSIPTTVTPHCVPFGGGDHLNRINPNKRFLFVEFLSCLLSHIQYLSHRVNLTSHSRSIHHVYMVLIIIMTQAFLALLFNAQEKTIN